MADGSLPRRVLGSLFERDFSRPFHFARRRLRRIATSPTYECIDRLEPPSWLTVDPPQAVLWLEKARGEPSSREYFRVVEGQADSNTTHVDPDRPFEGVEFSLVDCSHVNSLTVEGEFESEGGGRTVERFRYDLGDRRRATRGLDEISVDLTTSEAAVSASVTTRITGTRNRSRFSRFARGVLPSEFKTDDVPWMGVPAIRTTNDDPPIFLISVEALRHDHMDRFEPVLEALEGDGTVPQEPRIQGVSTQQSHGSLLTGLHPGDHHYTPYLDDVPYDTDRIDRELVTIDSFLAENFYKCSSIVGTRQLAPDRGFGPGFHRVVANDIRGEWLERGGDARSKIDRVIEWLDDDVARGWRSLFYFVQLFDPHDPYVPPIARSDDVDFTHVDALRPDTAPAGHEYVEWLESDIEVDEEHLDRVRQYYRGSLDYVAHQLVRFIAHLKRVGLYEPSLIVIAGDHGEEFFERGFRTHGSLNDASIRPGMIIKTPHDAWTPPQEVDYIDLLPTIAHELGVDTPSQTRGTPLQVKTAPDVRITERLSPKWYNVAIEEDGTKAILTYRGGARPSPGQLERGPDYEEYYELDAVRSGAFDDAVVNPAVAQRQRFRDLAEEFILDGGQPSSGD